MNIEENPFARARITRNIVKNSGIVPALLIETSSADDASQIAELFKDKRVKCKVLEEKVVVNNQNEAAAAAAMGIFVQDIPPSAGRLSLWRKQAGDTSKPSKEEVAWIKQMNRVAKQLQENIDSIEIKVDEKVGAIVLTGQFAYITDEQRAQRQTALEANFERAFQAVLADGITRPQIEESGGTKTLSMHFAEHDDEQGLSKTGSAVNVPIGYNASIVYEELNPVKLRRLMHEVQVTRIAAHTFHTSAALETTGEQLALMEAKHAQAKAAVDIAPVTLFNFTTLLAIAEHVTQTGLRGVATTNDQLTLGQHQILVASGEEVAAELVQQLTAADIRARHGSSVAAKVVVDTVSSNREEPTTLDEHLALARKLKALAKELEVEVGEIPEVANVPRPGPAIQSGEGLEGRASEGRVA